MTAEQALAAHGFTWERLERLAAAALHKCMRDRRIVLSSERKQLALEWYVEVGAAWAKRYDPALSRGVSFASSCFRRMYPRLTDFLRNERGDERRGNPLDQVPTDPSTLPIAGEHADVSSFDDEVDALASTLPDRARWTLEHLGRPIAEDDLSLAEAAARAGVTVGYAEELLEELGWRLGHGMPTVEFQVGALEDFTLIAGWAG